MANTVAPILRPVVNFWNDLLGNSDLNRLTEFRGGQGSHNAWHSKFLRAEKDQINNKYLSLQKRWTEDPEVLDLCTDNILRLTLLSGVERVIAIRQAYSVLKHRFFLPVNTMGTLGEVINGGFRTGYFKGAILNAVQFLGVNFNILLWAKGAGLTQQIIASSIFETVFHPVDTVKNILYTDTAGQYKNAIDVVGRVVQDRSVLSLFNGLSLKLTYNVFFLFHLRNMYENNQMQWISTPLWIFSYGFLALKTKLQVSGTALSFQNIQDIAQGSEKGLYRGVVPFVLLNYLFTYQLYGLYSQTAQDKQVASLRHTLQTEFKSPLAERQYM